MYIISFLPLLTFVPILILYYFRSTTIYRKFALPIPIPIPIPIYQHEYMGSYQFNYFSRLQVRISLSVEKGEGAST